MSPCQAHSGPAALRKPQKRTLRPSKALGDAWHRGGSAELAPAVPQALNQEFSHSLGPLPTFVTWRHAMNARTVARDRADGALCSAHARGQSPGRSPGTNSPQDCLCPGSLPRTGRCPVLLLYFAAQSAPPSRSGADGGVPARVPPAVPAEGVGCPAQRNKGGGARAARPGGHSRSGVPGGLGSRRYNPSGAARTAARTVGRTAATGRQGT